jgi:5-methylcytosine-specific restriction endonuclease McrA
MKTKVKTSTKKISISKLKKKLWKLFSQYIRTRDKYICFTCGRKGEGPGMHAGHFVSKSIGGINLYFDEDNVHAQCYNCNINLSGNQYEYAKRLGMETAERLLRLRTKIVKWSIQDYLNKIQYYEEKTKSQS